MIHPGNEDWDGRCGRIDADFLASMNDRASCRVHICRPPSMMDAPKVALLKLAVPENEVRTEALGTITRNPTGKTAHSTNIAGRVMFQASDTTGTAPVNTTILEVADEAGVFIDNACCSGTCASCRVKLLSGNVSMAVEDALTEQDRAEGYILTCQAKSTTTSL
jgi:ferredoxin